MRSRSVARRSAIASSSSRQSVAPRGLSTRLAPTSLRQRSDLDPPLQVVTSHRVEIRGWRRPQIESAFRAAGFGSLEFLGSYQKAPFDPAESRDLIMIAR